MPLDHPALTETEALLGESEHPLAAHRTPAPVLDGVPIFTRKVDAMPTPEDALPGRDEPIGAPGRHLVLGTPIGPPFPVATEQAIFVMGCFWGAEGPSDS